MEGKSAVGRPASCPLLSLQAGASRDKCWLWSLEFCKGNWLVAFHARAAFWKQVKRCTRLAPLSAAQACPPPGTQCFLLLTLFLS